MIKIAVTGASGFIGRSIIDVLNKIDVYVIAVSSSSDINRQPILKNGKWLCLNIYDEDTNFFEILEKPDILIHLAWGSLDDYCSNHHFEKELVLQYQFLKKIIIEGLHSVVITGTCFEYGMCNGMQDETNIVLPTTAYGFAKDVLRKQLEFLKESINFNLTWIRLFYLYGDRQRDSSLYKLMINAVQNKQTIFKMSGGEQLRDYLSVDVAAKNITSLAILRNDLGIINVCSGKPISVRRFVESFFEKMKYSIKLEVGYYPYVEYEPMAFWGSNIKLNRILHKK
jgi:nucleoside-diphosphate-sugar epimerase